MQKTDLMRLISCNTLEHKKGKEAMRRRKNRSIGRICGRNPGSRQVEPIRRVTEDGRYRAGKHSIYAVAVRGASACCGEDGILFRKAKAQTSAKITQER